MADAPDQMVATYYANLVSVHVTVDEVSLEFRRWMLPHREIWKQTAGGKKPPTQPSDEDVYAIDPVAKVVIAFTGAKALKEQLDSLLPQIEKLRKQG